VTRGSGKTINAIIAGAALIALVLTVFEPVRHHDFVDYDDPTFVTGNAGVKQGLTSESVRWAFSPANAYAATGGPLTWLSHMLDVELFGMTPGPHHLVSLMIHAINSLLLMGLLWWLTGALGRSFLVAALFAVHPLHVESVAWISERKDLLSTTFWLLTTFAYVAYTRRPGILRYVAVFVLLTLGLMAKPVLATLPFTLLILDAWPLARAPLSWSNRRRWLALVVEKLPLLVPAIGAMLMTISAQQQIGAVSGAATLPWTFRLSNAVVSYLVYLRKMVWPVDLAVFYPYPAHTSTLATGLAVVALVAMSVIAWRSARTRPYVTFGWFWYVGTLIPMIGLVQVGSHSMADRFTYVPLIGIFVIVVWGAAELLSSLQRGRQVAAAAAVVAVAACALTARAQVNTWRNSETLWTQALAVTDGNFRGHVGMAEVAAGRGELDSAIAHYKEAVRLAPDAPDWHVNLAMLLIRKGEIADAAAEFRRALQLKPDDAETHNNLGAMLSRLGAPQDAIKEYRRALELRPAYPLAQRNLGLALASSGDMAAGLRECLEALRQSPNEAQWHYEAAAMLLSLNRTGEAIAQLKEALRIAPTYREAQELLARLGK
jgi:Tfp pilus assembly protein PilF